MLHAKFQNNRPFGSEEEDFLKFFAIYSHGGHLGSVTLTIYTNFLSLFPRMLRIKLGFDWPNSFCERCLNIMVIYMYIAPGQRQTTPWGQNIFININILSICSLLARFQPSNDMCLFFPFKCMGDLS